MKLIREDEEYKYYVMDMVGYPVEIKVAKNRDWASIDLDEIAHAGGYKDTYDMITSNEHLMNHFLDGVKKGIIKIKDQDDS